MKLTCTINGQPAELEIQDGEISKVANQKTHLSQDDLAKRWGVSKRTVARISKHIGKTIIGRLVRHPLPDVKAYEESHTIKPRMR